MLRCPEVVGRMAEQHALASLLAHAGEGRGAAALVVGEAGVGKTRLIESVVDSAGGRVLVGRASVARGQTWLAPFTGVLLDCLPGLTDASLGPLWPVLAHLAPVPGDVAKLPDPSPTLIGHALLAAVESARPGSLVVLEDAHDLTPDAVAVTVHLLGAVRRRRVSLVLTTRPTEGAALTLVEAAARAGADRIELGPLSPDEAAAVARSCLPALPDSDRLRDLLADTDGLPLLIEDLLADAIADGTLVQAEGGWRWASHRGERVPQRFAELVEVRLARLDEATSATVRAAAVLGSRFPPRVLAAATALPSTRLAGCVRDAVAAQLLSPDGCGFRHALTRDAVRAATPTAEQALVAARLIADPAVSDVSGPLRAELVALAGHRDEAARLLWDIAESEAASGSPVAGGARLARARELALEPGLAAELSVRHIELLTLAGRLQAARAGAGLVRHLLPREHRVALELVMARASVAAGEPGAAAVEVAAARSLVSAGGLGSARVAAVEALVALAQHDDDRLATAEHLAQRSVAAARASGDLAALSEAWLVVGRCRRMRDLHRAEEAFRQALQAAIRAEQVLPRLQALHELGTITMFTDVDASALRLARQEAEAAGALPLVAGIDINLSATLLMRGEYEEGVAAARSAERLARDLGLQDVLPIAGCWQGLAAGFQGDLRSAESHFAAAEALAPEDPDVAAAANMLGRGMLALLAERRDLAAEALTRAARLGRPLMSDPSGGVVTLLRAVDGELGPEQLDRLQVVRGSRWTDLWFVTARAIVWGRSDRGLATTLLQGNLTTLRRFPVFGLVPLRYAAEAALVDGWGEPIAWLQEVERRASTGGWGPLASHARGLLRGAGVRVPRHRGVDRDVPDELRAAGVTAREYEVLRLLHDRPGNTALAEQLHLSVRTVEKHVASLRQKLLLEDREALTEQARRWKAEDGGPAPMTDGG